MLTLTSPVETWAHRLPASGKLAALALATTGLFLIGSPLAQGLALVATVGLYLSGGARFAVTGLRLLRPLWPFLLIVGLWHLYNRDVSVGTVILMRMMTAVALANFVTMTTRLSDMLGVIEGLRGPWRGFCHPGGLPWPSRW